MKIKHKESGEVIELMDGTKFATSAYDLVDDKVDAKAAEAAKAKAAKKAEEKAAKEAADAKTAKKVADAKAKAEAQTTK
jgi:hypothetical protein